MDGVVKKDYISLTGVPFLRGADFLFAVLAVATVDVVASLALVVLAFAAPLLFATALVAFAGAAFLAFTGSALAFASATGLDALAGAAFLAFVVFFVAFLGGTVSYLLPWTLGASTRCNRENFWIDLWNPAQLSDRCVNNPSLSASFRQLSVGMLKNAAPCQGTHPGYAKRKETLS